MGHTHYWRSKNSGPIPEAIRCRIATRAALALQICEDEHDIKVALEYDTPDHRPTINRTAVRFNGLGEQGYETFCLDLMELRDFHGCKTAHKAYDLAVMAVLWILRDEAGEYVEVSSDARMGVPEHDLERFIAPYNTDGPDEWAVAKRIAQVTHATLTDVNSASPEELEAAADIYGRESEAGLRALYVTSTATVPSIVKTLGQLDRTTLAILAAALSAAAALPDEPRADMFRSMLNLTHNASLLNA